MEEKEDTSTYIGCHCCEETIKSNKKKTVIKLIISDVNFDQVNNPTNSSLSPLTLAFFDLTDKFNQIKISKNNKYETLAFKVKDKLILYIVCEYNKDQSKYKLLFNNIVINTIKQHNIGRLSFHIIKKLKEPAYEHLFANILLYNDCITQRSIEFSE